MAAGFGLLYRRTFKARAPPSRWRTKSPREDHLEQAQRVAGVGSWEWDTGTHESTWSPEHARLHGWTDPEPPTPREVLDLIAPEDRARVSPRR